MLESMFIAFGTFGLICLFVGAALVAFGKFFTNSK